MASHSDVALHGLLLSPFPASSPMPLPEALQFSPVILSAVLQVLHALTDIPLIRSFFHLENVHCLLKLWPLVLFSLLLLLMPIKLCVMGCQVTLIAICMRSY